MVHEKNYHGLMEKILTSLGAQPEKWWFARHLVDPKPLLNALDLF
jgi:hypothetical protein